MAYAVDRLDDNRLKGLLRELLEAIEDCDDPVTLRKLGQSLKLLGDQARGRGYDLQKPQGNRTW